MSELDVSVRDIRVEDAGEVLTLQRAAFVQEALIYGSAEMPPLTQTLEELEHELHENLGCVALEGTRMIGAVRARMDGALLLVGRISIAPDAQGKGIGTLLLAEVERRGREAGATQSELFTGSLSEANLRLYEREGYAESQRVPGDDGTAQVFMRKALVP
ncbi:GNAT family N-acetyltransferase [Microbacterium sp. BK668]|uniref:GNAT family N-acetyltransferase n=1 Tax=Microbacterium sp. BK668 TaxID=2512118 RepID=UPI0010D01F7C|nr:GNAT family N-acetyltransferase [Microbacterium sp. BK668]TDN91365.1 N-acetylglutamate synthase-like GNAT family acetyltransferase [Microbacterium sp. BK668]